uniref:Tf2-1-like SH3-like domain-containing protein n=1 Tax=Triticum urartu TaxID=4572 RepID=A0A8R7P030_TRIUA
MKQHADKKRTPREVQVRDQVFLKLQPYIQTSMAHQASHKLSFKFFGPYTVIHRVNEVTYELQLPEGLSIFLVFHVSQLRKALTVGVSASSSLPSLTDMVNVPVEILDTRWHRGSNKMREQGLVRWQDPKANPDTWEDVEDLRRRFPSTPTWGQLVFEEMG